jgi:hypothetical protein
MSAIRVHHLDGLSREIESYARDVIRVFEPCVAGRTYGLQIQQLHRGGIPGRRIAIGRDNEAEKIPVVIAFAEKRNHKGTIFTLTGDRATGETYCLAHHITVNGGHRRLMLASLRYYDTFVKMDGAWLFAERLLYVDWVDERVLL